MKNILTKYILLACGSLLGFSLSTVSVAGDLNKLIEPCAQCHGKDSENPEEIPHIGGLPASYLRTTLMQYKNKERPCIIMCDIVKGYSNEDINLISDYFASQKFVRTTQKFDPELAKRGKSVHDKNCEICHAEGGAKANNSGILAGQKMPYLGEQFKFISEGTRRMPEAMMVNFRKLDKSNYTELIHYYGSAK